MTLGLLYLDKNVLVHVMYLSTNDSIFSFVLISILKHFKSIIVHDHVHLYNVGINNKKEMNKKNLILKMFFIKSIKANVQWS